MRSLAAFVTLACLLAAELNPVVSIPVPGTTSVTAIEATDGLARVSGIPGEILSARRHEDSDLIEGLGDGDICIYAPLDASLTYFAFCR